jgi:hypothetical protein
MPKITIHLPDQEPQKYSFDDQIEVNIGRSDDNDIMILHESLSGHHAQLKLVGDNYHLVDMDSTNGTFVDGEAAGDVPLHNGAQIIFGQVPADYECEEIEEPADDGPGFEPSGGSGFEHIIHAEVAEQSVMPGDFRNLSPIPKAEEKQTFANISMALGIIGILAAAAVAGFALMMRL